MIEERNWANMQDHADQLPFAERYCSDELDVYGELLWPPTPNPRGGNSAYVISHGVISHGKDETYTIEGMNNER